MGKVAEHTRREAELKMLRPYMAKRVQRARHCQIGPVPGVGKRGPLSGHLTQSPPLKLVQLLGPKAGPWHKAAAADDDNNDNNDDDDKAKSGEKFKDTL